MNKRFLLTLLTMPLALASAFADDAVGGPTVKFSGYGTAAVTKTNTDEAQFARPNQATGADKTARFGVDSNLGLQASITANETFSFTAQTLVRKDGVDDFRPELAWAFAKAKINDEFSVRVGRMGLPVFMISDYRNVGYANTMLRPPGEVYSQVPMNSIDGIDATFQRAFGDTNITAQLALGRTRATLATGAESRVHLEAKQISALNLVAEHGPLTLRFGRADTKITVSDSAQLKALDAALRGTAARFAMPQLATLADDLSVQSKKASFTSLGLALDWNNILVQSEFAKRKTDSYINDTTSWYVMGGYRIGKFLPYYSHANLKVDSVVPNTVPALKPLAALSAGVNALSSTGTQGAQSTDSIGLRWDFHRSAALKVQIDRIKPKNGQGLFLAPTPGFTGPVTVGAVAIDFVF